MLVTFDLHTQHYPLHYFPQSSISIIIIIIIIIVSFTAKIGSEKHNGDEIVLADRLLL